VNYGRKDSIRPSQQKGNAKWKVFDVCHLKKNPNGFRTYLAFVGRKGCKKCLGPSKRAITEDERTAFRVGGKNRKGFATRKHF